MYSADLRKHYMLDNPSWKRDIMPEIIEGKNILDYVDPEIEAKLEALEMEEEALAAAAAIEVILYHCVAQTLCHMLSCSLTRTSFWWCSSMRRRSLTSGIRASPCRCIRLVRLLSWRCWAVRKPKVSVST